MAIFTPNFSIVGGGRAGARSSATSWCDYVMREGQYQMKDGFEYSNVLLPKGAPEEWKDPYILWGAIDEKEKQWNGQTGREFMVPLPRELTLEQNIELAESWAHENLVKLGMPAHVVIHVNDQGEMHTHTTVPMRRLNNKGEWANKRITIYPVRRDGVEIEIESTYWKTMEADGWEKVFAFEDGTTWSKSEALARGYDWKLDRVRTSDGKLKPLQKNPKVTDWDDRSNAKVWRKSWEVAINAALDKYVPGTEHVDCRSYADRGIDRIPQIKQGAGVTEIERGEMRRCAREGIEYKPITVVGAKNAEIEKINDLLDLEIPRDAKDELLECGKALKVDTNLNTAEEVREKTSPYISRAYAYVKATVINTVRRIADRVLALPVVSTIRTYIREMKRNGVNIKEREDLVYDYGRWSFEAEEVGNNYTRDGVQSILDGKADGHTFDPRLISAENTREHSLGISEQDHGWMNLDDLIEEAKSNRQKNREDASKNPKHTPPAHNPSIFDMSRGAEAAASQNAATSRNKSKGHGGPGDDGVI